MLPPIDFRSWIEDHRHLLKPPVGNKCIWEEGAFICMVVGGPNQRTDYHVDPGPEFFQQIEGDMVLRIMEPGGPRDVSIREGEIFLLPPNVPHSPQRRADTVGLVIERQRLPHERDGLVWYCEQCHEAVFERFFHLENIETQFPPIFAEYDGDPAKRTCARCGHVNGPTR